MYINIGCCRVPELRSLLWTSKHISLNLNKCVVVKMTYMASEEENCRVRTTWNPCCSGCLLIPQLQVGHFLGCCYCHSTWIVWFCWKMGFTSLSFQVWGTDTSGVLFMGGDIIITPVSSLHIYLFVIYNSVWNRLILCFGNKKYRRWDYRKTGGTNKNGFVSFNFCIFSLKV